MSKKNQLNWWNLAKKYWKEQIFFYFLTILSFLGSWFIAQNAFKLAWEKIKDGEIKHEIKWLGDVTYDFGKDKVFFLVTMAIIILIYCAIVVAHVYYCIYLENKIVGAIKKKLVTKFLQLKNSYDKKQILNNLTSDAVIFTKNVVHVPNQIFYMILDTTATFSMMQSSQVGKKILWSGAGYLLLILLLSSFFNFLLYKNDLILQKRIETQIYQENILVNNRNLIIKKGLKKNFITKYEQTLEDTRQAANKKDWFFALAYVVPSYSLIKYASFFFYPFINSLDGWTAFSMLTNLFDALKKMIERLKECPYYFSAKNRLNKLISQEDRNDIQKNLLIDEKIETISLKNVTFGYDKNLPVLKDKNLIFQKGQINNLEGNNGSGKSTVINLILGLYQPQEGEILVNNKYKLSEVNLNELRNRVAYGEHQNLVENDLSTGQRQLVDLSNIFADNKKEVFIFDEAINSLDEDNKEEFRKKINQISKSKLTILISH